MYNQHYPKKVKRETKRIVYCNRLQETNPSKLQVCAGVLHTDACVKQNYWFNPKR